MVFEAGVAGSLGTLVDAITRSCSAPLPLSGFPCRQETDDLLAELDQRDQPRPRHVEHLRVPTVDQFGERQHFLQPRSEEHTSELQSLTNLVCRLLLEKKNKKKKYHR